MTEGTLLILHDSPDFGGHERMLLMLLPAVLADFARIVVCLPAGNRRLAEALMAVSLTIRHEPWPFVKRRGEPYLAPFRRRYRTVVGRIVAMERPAVTLMVQGRIENLATPMLALPAAEKVVSYLPMAHAMAEIGRGAMLGDAVRRRLYRRPDAFIVPSLAVAAQVRRAGGAAPVTVAPNVVTPPPRTARGQARVMTSLPANRRIALLLGRLDTAQKGIDRLVTALVRDVTRLGDWTFLIVGDGAGRAALDGLAATGLDVRLLPWTDRPDLYLSAADVLLLPSRWEGLPLVLLEAMTYGLPVLGSEIDVLSELLPAANRHDFANGEIAAALERVVTVAATAHYQAHAAAVLRPRTLQQARTAFAGAIAAVRQL